VEGCRPFGRCAPTSAAAPRAARGGSASPQHVLQGLQHPAPRVVPRPCSTLTLGTSSTPRSPPASSNPPHRTRLSNTPWRLSTRPPATPSLAPQPLPRSAPRANHSPPSRPAPRVRPNEGWLLPLFCLHRPAGARPPLPAQACRGLPWAEAPGASPCGFLEMTCWTMEGLSGGGGGHPSWCGCGRGEGRKGRRGMQCEGGQLLAGPSRVGPRTARLESAKPRQRLGRVCRGMGRAPCRAQA